MTESSKFEAPNLKQILNTNDRNSKPSVLIRGIGFLIIGIYLEFRNSCFGFLPFVDFKVNGEPALALHGFGPTLS